MSFLEKIKVCGFGERDEDVSIPDLLEESVKESLKEVDEQLKVFSNSEKFFELGNPFEVSKSSIRDLRRRFSKLWYDIFWLVLSVKDLTIISIF